MVVLPRTAEGRRTVYFDAVRFVAEFLVGIGKDTRGGIILEDDFYVILKSMLPTECAVMEELVSRGRFSMEEFDQSVMFFAASASCFEDVVSVDEWKNMFVTPSRLADTRYFGRVVYNVRRG